MEKKKERYVVKNQTFAMIADEVGQARPRLAARRALCYVVVAHIFSPALRTLTKPLKLPVASLAWALHEE